MGNKHVRCSYVNIAVLYDVWPIGPYGPMCKCSSSTYFDNILFIYFQIEFYASNFDYIPYMLCVPYAARCVIAH